MAKLNENESYVVKAAESLANTVNDSAKYNSFMEQLKYLFDQYEMTKPGRDKIADRIYNILQKNGVDVARDIFDADMETLKTVDFITVSADELEDIKKSAKLKKGLIIAGCVIGAGLIGFSAAKIASTPTSIEKTTDNNDVDADLEDEDVMFLA